METKVFPVAVIGGGSAGTMAVLRTVLNNDECLFFPGSPKDKKKSRALWVRKVENVPAHFNYKRGIEEPNAETLKWIAASEFSQKLHLQKNIGVTSLTKNENGIFEITDSKGAKHQADFIILCTGVMDVQPVIKNSIETVFDYANAQTIDYCLVCDGHHVLGKRTGIIGHVNGAAWVAIILHERYQSPLTIFTNGEKAQFEADTSALISKYGIKVMEAPIQEIFGEEKGKILKGFQLATGETVELDICFVSMGMIVYNQLAVELGAKVDERGFVLTDEVGLSSISGLYVAGDLKAGVKKQIYTAWDTAVNSAIAINQKIRAKKRDLAAI